MFNRRIHVLLPTFPNVLHCDSTEHVTLVYCMLASPIQVGGQYNNLFVFQLGVPQVL